MRNKNNKKKVIYKVRNWSKYNKSLVKRGNITLWFNKKSMSKWYHQGEKTKGAQKIYSIYAIKIMLIFRNLFNLKLRSLQGFMVSLIYQMGIRIDIPDYTTICRRQKEVNNIMGNRKILNGNVDVIIDSTGIKVFGEGEWKVRRHGYTKHRMWRKVHIAINKSGEIISEEITTNEITDADAGEKMLKNISGIKNLFTDAAYDKKKIYDLCKDKGIMPIIKPRGNALIRKEKGWEKRNDNIRRIHQIGIKEWKKESGFSKRSLVETTMYRYKKTFGDKPLAYKLDNQKIEVKIKCMLLNEFLKIGRPDSYKVAI